MVVSRLTAIGAGRRRRSPALVPLPGAWAGRYACLNPESTSPATIGAGSALLGGRLRVFHSPPIIAPSRLTLIMIRRLKSGEYRLYSRKKDPKTGRRRNLGTFTSLQAAKKHERAVQFFKRAH